MSAEPIQPAEPGTVPPPAVDYLQAKEEERRKAWLRILEICHYVFGGFLCLWGCMFALIFVGGVFIYNDPVARVKYPNGTPGLGAIVMGLIFMSIFLTIGILNIVSGRKIRGRKAKVLSFVTAGLNCLNCPFGITLAIFTFVILSNDGVKRMYETTQSPHT